MSEETKQIKSSDNNQSIEEIKEIKPNPDIKPPEYVTVPLTSTYSSEEIKRIIIKK